MGNGAEINGEDTPNGLTHTPRTPSLNGFSLTEYTANPTPPRLRSPSNTSVVPRDYRLPNGYPDVGNIFNNEEYEIELNLDSTCVSFLRHASTKLLMKRSSHTPPNSAIG